MQGTRLTLPSAADDDGNAMIDAIDPENDKLPPKPVGAEAFHDTPVALTTTPRPLESTRAATWVAARSSTSVPATAGSGDAGTGKTTG